jgi:5-methylcytosine-specific restriction endonuclease McrA
MSDFLPFPKPVKQEKKRKSLKRRGKKTDAWDATRKLLIPRFEAAGIVQCELQWPGCWKNNALSFAHSKKRRKVEGDELSRVALLCQNCHHTVEYRKDMTQIIEEVISRRKVLI